MTSHMGNDIMQGLGNSLLVQQYKTRDCHKVAKVSLRCNSRIKRAIAVVLDPNISHVCMCVKFHDNSPDGK